ncbi:RNA polymerase II mediator complex subunit [Cryptotrichosporon argae]
MPPTRYAPTAARPTAGGKGPLRGRRSATGAAGSSAGELVDAVEIEDFAPPSWRTVLNNRIDYGYPDFYPSRPGFGQPEDVLTEKNVKEGFSNPPPVHMNAESFSMHTAFHTALTDKGGLKWLMDTGRDIIKARDEAMPKLGERVFRISPRVTYNDAKRLAFLADLGNPAVPLLRLMRQPVPHGFKGVELLDTVFAPPSAVRAPAGESARPLPAPVPVDRAVWFVRVLGANEIAAHRGRTQPALNAVSAPSPAAAATPSSTATANTAPLPPLSSNDWYTAEFTNVFTAWLRAQLAQLTLPNPVGAANAPKAPGKPGMPAAKTVPSVLSDPKSRARWSAKWQYSMALLEQLRAKRLISIRLFMGWLVDNLGAANLAQVGFLAGLLAENVEHVLEHLAIARHCIRACCAKIEEIRASPARDAMMKIEEMLIELVRTLFTSNPEVLLSSRTWFRHAEMVRAIVAPSELSAVGPSALEQIEQRNARLAFVPAKTEGASSPRRQQMAELQKLDSMCADTDMVELCRAFFSGPCTPSNQTIDLAKLEDKVFILLNWAMGLYQLGSHRPYAVYTLLKLWLEIHNERPTSAAHPAFDFFPILFKWLDTSAAARKADNALAIGITFGEFTRQGIWSYGRYLQALIARGQTARANLPEPSHHLALLKVMPIFVPAQDLLAQRRLALSGDNAEKRRQETAEEERLLEAFKQEVQEYIPEVFGLTDYGRLPTYRDGVSHVLPSAASLSRFLFLQARFWLAPAFDNILRRGILDVSVFCRILDVYRQCRGYSSMADLLVKVTKQSSDPQIILVVIDTVRREADVWTAMDRWRQLSQVLLARFRTIQVFGAHHHALSALLLELGQKKRLPAEDANEVRCAVEADAAVKIQTPPGWGEPSQSMEAVRQVLVHKDTDKAAILSSRLFTRHGPFATWATLWWATVVGALDSVRHSSDPGVVAFAMAHIADVDRIAGGHVVGPVVTAWVAGLTTASRTALLSGRPGSPLVAVLLNLVIQRHTSAAVILDHLVYPGINAAALACTNTQPRLSSKRVRTVDSAVAFASQLLLCTGANALPPSTLYESLVLQTSRAQVFASTGMELVIKHLPDLVVLKHAKAVPAPTSDAVSALLGALSTMPQFKTAAFRHLELLKDAMLSNGWIKRSSEPAIEAGMVDALKAMMSDRAPGTKTPNSLPTLEQDGRLSPWRWTRIVLELRVEFKRLALRIANNDDVAEAKQAMNRLVRSSLNREASTDDVDLLCEAFRGVEPVVVQEILSVGLERLDTLLAAVLAAETQPQLAAVASSIELVLRVIDSTSRSAAVKVDTAGLGARTRILSLLAVALKAIERQVVTADDDHPAPVPVPVDLPKPEDTYKIILTLLRFTLGVSGPDVQAPNVPRPDYAALAVAFLHLCAAVLAESTDGPQELADLLANIVDAAPLQVVPAIHTALAYELTTPSIAGLVSRHPCFATVLPATRAPVRAMSIHTSSVVDPSMDAAITLDDRPWELFEHMAPPRAPANRGEYFLSSRPFKDTTSIALALFGPQMTRDDVPPPYPVDEAPWTAWAAERTWGNGLAGEPRAARQAATRLYARDEPDKDADDPPPSAPDAPLVHSRRRLSTRIAEHAAKAAGTDADPISILDDDDESDESELDVLERPPAGKRSRTSTAGSSTAPHAQAAKRPSTGGKAVPRKTTGGKSVARKATGGKTVRATSGKAVKSRK